MDFGPEDAADVRIIISNHCEPGNESGTFGVSDGAFVINDIEGQNCCPGSVSFNGDNLNTAIIVFVATMNYCNATLRLNVSARGDFEPCLSGGLNPIGCTESIPGFGGNAGDGVSITVERDASTVLTAAYCGGMRLGNFSTQLGDITIGESFVVLIMGGTQDGGEFYQINDIEISGSTMPPFPAEITSTSTTLCEGEDLLVLNEISGGQSYRWTFDGVDLNNNSANYNSSDLVTPADAGTYAVTVTYPSGCEAMASINIDVLPAENKIREVDFTSLDLTYCSYEVLRLPSLSDNGIVGTWDVIPDLEAAEVKIDSITFTPNDSSIDPLTLAIEITIVDTINVPPFVRCANSPPLLFLNTMFSESADTILFVEGRGDDCDTLYNVIVSFLEPNFLEIADTICEGESVEYYNQIFDINNPSDQFNVLGQNGDCDTTVRVVIDFLNFTPMRIEGDYCQGDTVMIRGRTFTSEQPSDQFTIAGGGGTCDTMLTIDLNFIAPLELNISDTICPMESVVRFGNMVLGNTVDTTFIIPGISPTCDSIINLSVFRYPEFVTSINEPEICEEDTLFILGEAFHTNRLSGQVVTLSRFGCDSIIAVDLRPGIEEEFIFLDPCGSTGNVWRGQQFFNDTSIVITAPSPACDTLFNIQFLIGEPIDSLIQMELCQGEELNLLGEVFDEANSTGTVLESPPGLCPILYQVELTYRDTTIRDFSAMICAGDTLQVGSQFFFQETQNNPVTLIGQNGCDSVVNVSVEIQSVTEEVTVFNCDLPVSIAGVLVEGDTVIQVPGMRPDCDTLIAVLAMADTIQENLAIDFCEGDTIEILGELFHGNRREATIFSILPSGCVSETRVNTTMTDVIRTTLSRTFCPGESIEIDGVLFDESNPIGDLIYTSECDSIVTVELDYITTVNLSEFIQLCPGDTAMFFGIEVYEGRDFTLPINRGPNGCDTSILITVDLLEVQFDTIREVLCNGDSILIAGAFFSTSNLQSDIELQGSNGCDSLLAVRVELLDTYSLLLEESICAGESQLINGVVYDENNLTGVEILTSREGCDSIVEIALSVLPSYSLVLDSFICDPGLLIQVGNGTYSINKSTGIEMLSSTDGCDSIISVNLNYGVDVLEEEFVTTCPDEMAGMYRIVNGADSVDMAFLNGVLGMIEGSDIVFSNLSAGSYDLELEFANGCIRESEILITAFPQFQLETSIIQNDNSATVTILNTGQIDSIAWEINANVSCLDCPSVTIAMSSQSIYNLTIIDVNGCISTHIIEIEESTMMDTVRTVQSYVPNVLSPDGDPRNRFLYLSSRDETIISYSLQIFDRWGNLIFAGENLEPNVQELGWNGSQSNGEPTSDVFVYKMSQLREDGTEEIIYGDVLVVL